METKPTPQPAPADEHPVTTPVFNALLAEYAPDWLLGPPTPESR